MTTVFADTFYFLALLDSREDRHRTAVAASALTGRVTDPREYLS
jgi:predicted nucleic acid-binding protein